MTRRAFVLCVGLAIIAAPASPHARQDPATVARPQTPALTDAEMEQFLRKARVIKTKGTAKGVTASLRATLTDGTVTHDAHIQTVDERKIEFRARDTVEYNFRDSWRFNVAVYKLDRLLGLNLVPVSIERGWKGDLGAYTWWVDDVMMDEGERLKKKMGAPNPTCWNEQMRLVRVLDQLIDNVDRNMGNLLITNAWRIWAIDHTRAFRYSKTPRNPANLTGIDRGTLQRLETLDLPALKKEIGKYVQDSDIRAILSRRDAMVTHFRAMGDSAFFDRSDPAVGCLGS